jgi:antitoxin component YwqK of YwqJK toxin-antitoxin module
VSYFEDGQISYEGNYEDGEKNGQWISHYENGRIRSEASFRAGRLDGAFASYYANARMRLTKHHKDGQWDGRWVSYDEDGNVTDVDIWEKGRCVAMCEGDEVAPCARPAVAAALRICPAGRRIRRAGP